MGREEEDGRAMLANKEKREREGGKFFSSVFSLAKYIKSQREREEGEMGGINFL